MSMSGAFDASTSAVVTPRPDRPSGVRASVSPNSVCVRLSMALVIYLHVSKGFGGTPRRRGRVGAIDGARLGVECTPRDHAASDRYPASRNQIVFCLASRRTRLSLDRSR